MDIESGAPRPSHRVKYLAVVVVAVTIAMMAVIAVIVDAPGRISRALSGSSGKDLFLVAAGCGAGCGARRTRRAVNRQHRPPFRG
ncbi:hypothetical protein RQCS_60450 (plasmid) [Rhodococcus qingshengii]|uniref:hypothetical protein n=1 Tax=Rhodococcus qingshengii TaxID=334542 RepID=UPI0007E5AC50|nr:hypothetical protein [Rhodococcus qingshengii]BCF86500.1 hypothetical protein RQCS_60450 [Rhodococcus qingshengii]